MSPEVRVRGNATAEELAVLVALMSHLERAIEPDRYAEWRRGRVAVLRERVGR